MLKQGSFTKNKYNKLLICNLLTSSAYGINIMIDSLIGGHQLGETALSAVSIVSPIYSVVIFCSYLFSQGFGINFGKYTGRFQEDKANKIAGQSLIASLASSVIMLAVLSILKEPFLNYYHCTDELYQCASVYYNWALVYVCLYPLNMCLYRLILTDGDGLFSMLGSVGEIVVNVILSVVLCSRIGISGLAIATNVGTIVSIIFYLCHFFLKTNSIHFKAYWSFNELKDAFILSFSTSVNFIFVAIVDFVMNKVIQVSCGMEMIPAYSSINLLFNIYFIFEAVFDSCAGFCSTFLGENNNYGLKYLAKMGIKSILKIGVVLTISCFLLAPLVPSIYGLKTQIVVTKAIEAVRIMSLGAIPYGIVTFAYMIYPAISKASLSTLIAFLYNLFCPLLLSIPLAFIFGFTGISIGMASSSYLVCAIVLIVILTKYGKKGFPLYLPDYHEDVISFDLLVTQKDIDILTQKINDALIIRGYYFNDIDVLFDELYTIIMQKNPNKKVLSECTIFFGADYVRFLVRDNGKIFNFIQEEKSEQIKKLLDQYRCDYCLTTSFNRHGFIFKKSN